MKIGPIYNKVLSLVFLFIIMVAMIMYYTSKKEPIDKLENRQLAEYPEFDITQLDPYPSKYNDYYSDHFPLKSQTVKLFSKLNIHLLKVSPLPQKVIVGKNDFLFIAGEQMDTYLGNNLFTNEELELVLKELEFRRDFCSKLGAKFYFAIIPQKQTIYSENIPNRIKVEGNKTMRTQLEAYLEANHFQVIDPTNQILEKKSEEFPLYFKTDNHWNILGAFYGTQVIIERIKQDFPQVKPLDISDYAVSKAPVRAGNLAQMLNLQDELPDEKMVLAPLYTETAVIGQKVPYTPVSGFGEPDKFEIVYVNPEVNDLKAVIIRESFAGNQKAFYKETFGKTVFIWDRWQYKLNEDILKNEMPDIVVIQLLESQLRKLLIYQSMNSQQSKTVDNLNN